jgi:hypothetical protein
MPKPRMPGFHAEASLPSAGTSYRAIGPGPAGSPQVVPQISCDWLGLALCAGSCVATCGSNWLCYATCAPGCYAKYCH